MTVDPIMLLPWFLGGILLCYAIVKEIKKAKKAREFEEAIKESEDAFY